MSTVTNEQLVRDVVGEVLSRLSGTNGSSVGGPSQSAGLAGRYGVFDRVDDAVAAANNALYFGWQGAIHELNLEIRSQLSRQ